MGPLLPDDLVSSGFRVSGFDVYPALNRVEGPNGVTRLEPRIMAVLMCLARRPGTVVPRDELIWEVWGPTGATDDVLSRAVSAIRKALGETSHDPRLIETIPKSGYRLTVAPTPIGDGPTTSTNLQTGAEPAGASEGGSAPGVARVEYASRHLDRWRRIAWIAGAAVTLAAVGVAFLKPHVRDTPEWMGIRFDRPAHVISALDGDEVHPALSPDGTRLAYAWRARPDSAFDLKILDLGAGRPSSEIPVTETPFANEVSPAWAPDGSYLAFLRLARPGCEVMVLEVATGIESSVYSCSIDRYDRLRWSPTGDFLVLRGQSNSGTVKQLFRLDIDKTSPTRSGLRPPHPITSAPPHFLGDDAFAISPDGQSIVVARLEGEASSDVHRLDLRTGSLTRLTDRHGSVFDLLWIDAERVWASTDWSPERGLWRVDLAGGDPEVVANTAVDLLDLSGGPGVGPLVFRQLHNDVDLVRVGLEGSAADDSAIMGSTRADSKPAISPDGRRLAFESNRTGPYEIWTSQLDGSDARQITYLGGSYNSHPRWSPDGKRVVFEGRPDGRSDIYTVETTGSAVRRLTNDMAQDVTPSWSHDGASIFFSSDRSGQWEIWERVQAGGMESRLTWLGGMAPQASSDGRYLYYAKPYDAGVWRVDLEAARAGRAEEQRVQATLPVGDYDAWALTDRVLVTLERNVDGGGQLRLFDRETALPPTVIETQPTPRYYGGIAISPDGRYAIVAVQSRLENDLGAFTSRPTETRAGRD